MSKPNPQGLLYENNKKSVCPSLVKERGRNDSVCEEVCIFYVLSVVIASIISACENETARCISTSTREDEESGHSSCRRQSSETANSPLRPGKTSLMYGYNEAKAEGRWGKSTIHLRS